MSLFILILGVVYTVICVFLIMVVLMQSGKGGGLSGMLGGANPLTDALGSSGAEKTLSKWTTICAVCFFVLALLLTVLAGKLLKPSRLSDQLKSSAPPIQAPAAPSSQIPVGNTPESPAPATSENAPEAPSDAEPAEATPAPPQGTPSSEPSPSSP
jgi:preprotein translocase subunit SecG